MPRFRRAHPFALLALLLSVAAVVTVVPRVASARPAPAAAEAAEHADPDKPSPETLAKAKELFRQGNEMRKAEDYERALAFYTKSRKLVASVPNTINAAICLDKLGRFDEALELYEVLLTQLSADLTKQDREAIRPEMRRLRTQVGSIFVIANVDGKLVIDGRDRGQLPLDTAVRVLPGEHTVGVMKAGYEGFTTKVTVALRKTAKVDAQLKPLAASGGLRIEDDKLAGAEVFVDGAAVGTIPWEGTLGPGEHRYFVRLDDVGSAPRKVVVVTGQTVLGAVKVGPLGPELRIETKPPTAELLIDDVPVGTGRWQGRLPLGDYALVAREDGYFPQERTLAVGEDTQGDVVLTLDVDEEHPRWGVSEAGTFFLDAFGGVALSTTLDSGAEDYCADDQCSDEGTALGFLVGARGGYEFPIGISIQVAGGYMQITKELTRTIEDSFTVNANTVTTTYELTDELHVTGGFAGAGIGYRVGFAEVMEFRSNLLVGALFASTSDTVSGMASAGGQPIPAVVQGSGNTTSGADLFIMPEAHLGLRFGGFGVSLGLTVGLFVLDGPVNDIQDVEVRGNGCTAAPEEIDCAPGESLISDERAFGTFVTWMPTLSAGYAF